MTAYENVELPMKILNKLVFRLYLLDWKRYKEQSEIIIN